MLTAPLPDLVCSTVYIAVFIHLHETFTSPFLQSRLFVQRSTVPDVGVQELGRKIGFLRAAAVVDVVFIEDFFDFGNGEHLDGHAWG